MHAACTNVQSPPPPSFVAAWLEKYPIFVWWEKAFRKIFAQPWGDSYGRHQWTFILSLLHTRQQLLFSVHNHVLSLPLAHFFHSFSIHTRTHILVEEMDGLLRLLFRMLLQEMNAIYYRDPQTAVRTTAIHSEGAGVRALSSFFCRCLVRDLWEREWRGGWGVCKLSKLTLVRLIIPFPLKWIREPTWKSCNKNYRSRFSKLNN